MIKKLAIPILLLIMLITGCKKEESIEDFIEREKLVDILVDFHIAEAALTQYIENGNDSIKTVYLTQILKIHDLKKVELDKIISLLYKNTAYNRDIMKDVLTTIDSLDTKFKDKR